MSIYKHPSRIEELMARKKLITSRGLFELFERHPFLLVKREIQLVVLVFVQRTRYSLSPNGLHRTRPRKARPDYWRPTRSIHSKYIESTYQLYLGHAEEGHRKAVEQVGDTFLLRFVVVSVGRRDSALSMFDIEAGTFFASRAGINRPTSADLSSVASCNKHHRFLRILHGNLYLSPRLRIKRHSAIDYPQQTTSAASFLHTTSLFQSPPICINDNSAALSAHYLSSQLSALWKNADDCVATEAKNHVVNLHFSHRQIQGGLMVADELELGLLKEGVEKQGIFADIALGARSPAKGHCNKVYPSKTNVPGFKSNPKDNVNIKGLKVAFRLPFTRHVLEDHDKVIGNGPGYLIQMTVLDLKNPRLVLFADELDYSVKDAASFYLKKYLHFLHFAGHNVLFHLPNFDKDTYRHAIDYSLVSKVLTTNPGLCKGVDVFGISFFSINEYLRTTWIDVASREFTGRSSSDPLTDCIWEARSIPFPTISAISTLDLSHKASNLCAERRLCQLSPLLRLNFSLALTSSCLILRVPIRLAIDSFRDWKFAFVLDVIHDKSHEVTLLELDLGTASMRGPTSATLARTASGRLVSTSLELDTRRQSCEERCSMHTVFNHGFLQTYSERNMTVEFLPIKVKLLSNGNALVIFNIEVGSLTFEKSPRGQKRYSFDAWSIAYETRIKMVEQKHTSKKIHNIQTIKHIILDFAKCLPLTFPVGVEYVGKQSRMPGMWDNDSRSAVRRLKNILGFMGDYLLVLAKYGHNDIHSVPILPASEAFCLTDATFRALSKDVVTVTNCVYRHTAPVFMAFGMTQGRPMPDTPIRGVLDGCSPSHMARYASPSLPRGSITAPLGPPSFHASPTRAKRNTKSTSPHGINTATARTKLVAGLCSRVPPTGLSTVGNTVMSKYEHSGTREANGASPFFAVQNINSFFRQHTAPRPWSSSRTDNLSFESRTSRMTDRLHIGLRQPVLPVFDHSESVEVWSSFNTDVGLKRHLPNVIDIDAVLSELRTALEGDWRWAAAALGTYNLASPVFTKNDDPIVQLR
ncbi:hypothetical protein BDN71DRAFT_1433611 [Pleurotus eryngii]|uniref:Uncharacterized protein n=1 Tax=Pleurotus eryngii TaxID=5323 RepID=A0A9P5ZUA1_PLEER|nr:hypothetical protein BDN71DRAFT_1433611 [Pleurotus eryngii]